MLSEPPTRQTAYSRQFGQIVGTDRSSGNNGRGTLHDRRQFICGYNKSGRNEQCRLKMVDRPLGDGAYDREKTSAVEITDDIKYIFPHRVIADKLNSTVEVVYMPLHIVPWIEIDKALESTLRF